MARFTDFYVRQTRKPMKYTVHYHGAYFEVKTSGVAEFKGFQDFAKSLIEHDMWKPGSNILIDHTELDASLLTTKDIRTIANLCGEYRTHFGKGKIAIIVARDLEYGMVRMWQAFMENNVWDMSDKLFKSRDEAKSWMTA